MRVSMGEQIGKSRWLVPGDWRFIKRRTNRKRRRLERLLLEDAPTKNAYKGTWA